VTLYRYNAFSRSRGQSLRGHMQADSPAQLRASLLRIGLQVTDMRALHDSVHSSGILLPARQTWNEYLRSRRQSLKSELFDALSTMLDAGLPISESLDNTGGKSGPLHELVIRLCADVNSGKSLAQASTQSPDWFDYVEIQMIAAGESAGTLPSVLRRLSDRHQRTAALKNKLLAVLTYPLIVLCVGLGVVLFLSSRTLPDLVAMLIDAGVDPPALTIAIITSGQLLLNYGPLLLIGLPLLGFAFSMLLHTSLPLRTLTRHCTAHCTPTTLRRLHTASFFGLLAELLAVGIPLVEALRTVSTTLRGIGTHQLAQAARAAADGVSAGQTLCEAFPPGPYLDATTHRLMHVGETSGELPDLLVSIATREYRKAQRAIETLARLAEPIVILALSAIIGLVVMGAVLPLIKMQDIIQ
jgi:general secretion pathway protein F